MDAKVEFAGLVRPATMRDLPVVLEMVAGLAKHHGDVATVTPEELARDILGPRPWVQVLLADVDGTCVGYAALCPLSKLQFGQRGMDLMHLFVTPNARRIGVGKSLIAAGQAFALNEGCQYLSVGTHPDNVTAHEIYPALGFDRLDPPGPRFHVTLDP